MARKIYKRFGLRRDKNFGDLSDARLSLNNLLDGLVDTVGNTYISEDLNAIRNINNIGLDNNQYLKVVGSTTKFTPSGGGANISFVPHITYQNRIDQFTVFSGEPRISGGNGPTAKYWQKDQILVNQENASEGKKFEYWQNTNSAASEVLAGVTTMGQLPSDTQWEAGNFDYSGKLHPQSVLTDGGVTWEGYFVATKTGPHTFHTNTTGYTTFDFNLDGYEEDNDKNQTPTSITAVGAGNTYKEYARVGVTTTFTGSGSANTNVITIQANYSKTIGIGMSVSGTGLVSGTGGSGETIWPTVESYGNAIDGNTSTVTLKPIPGQTNSVGGSNFTNNNLTFFRNLGQNIEVRFTTQYLIEFRRYRFRVRFFFPNDVNTGYLQRKINFDYNMPTQSDIDLYYYRLFDLNYTFTEAKKGGFNKFFDASVRFGGTDPIGIGGTIAETGKPNPFVDNNPYVKVKTSDKIQAKYSPKTTLAAIEKRSQSCGATAGGTVITCSSTGGIEIGNYVFGPNTDDSTNIVAEGSRVIDIGVNEILVIDRPAQVTGTQTLKFVDHRGFVKRVKGAATTSGGTTVDFATGYTTDNTDKWKEELKSGMIVLTTPQSGTNVPSYTRITFITDSNTVLLSNGMSNSANTPIYIYQSRGLVDNSLITFCPQTGGATTRCRVLSAIAAKDQNEIQLTSVSGLSNGLIVEGFGIPANTEIDSISGNTITLSANLGKDINVGATVTIHEAALTGDRQLCCPPTDTSPPFSATPRGLITPDDKRNLSFAQGNIKFDELRFKFTTSDAGTPSVQGRIEKYGTGNTDVTRKIHIRTGAVQDQPNGLFYLLGTTS